ncbi:MAG TPA: GNAT family N-acetyltransferase [Pyrinomonadaceae bacterium]|jgi:ribosomal-protein-alanine N-acetyltransferase|nr:GNAT family N-acetyltransferase [Pyrinomonadaceae bacterium]
MKTLPIVGARILLRSPTRKDQTEFISLNRTSVSFHRGLVSPPKTPEQFAAFLRKSGREDSVSLLICLVTDGAIIGAINLSQIFRGGFQSAYLGYYIGAQYAGQGYMTEALRLALRYAFQGLKLHRLEANIQPGNNASIALVRRAGFIREGYSRRYLKISGRWRDHERWAIVTDDWKAKP